MGEKEGVEKLCLPPKRNPSASPDYYSNRF